MVAFLTKTEGNDDFADIVDFLNASSIRYSLTINPTVAGKSVVVTESSVRSDLHFNDEDGATCLTTVEIFENLALMGYERDSDKLSFEKALFSPHWKYLIHTILHCLSSKSTAWNEFSTNVASAVICLAKGQKVLDLEKAMTAQAKEIAILKKRVKKLEKRKRSRTQGLKLFKIDTSKRRSLDKEDASKHGRNLNVRLISEEDDFDVGFDVVRDEVNAGVSVSTAEPKTPPTITTTTLLEDDKVTVVATLVQMSETSKAKSIVFEDVEESAKKQREGKAPIVEDDYYTEEDWDIIRANVESNAELSKILLGENEPGEDFVTRMVNLLNQRKKFFAEQRAQARRNRHMTQTQQRTYMSTYLKHQGSWTFAQLKKLSDEEIKAKYERLVRSIANFVPMGAKVKEQELSWDFFAIMKEVNSDEVVKAKYMRGLVRRYSKTLVPSIDAEVRTVQLYRSQ
ncbi:hypothetical protein Tco_0370025 [Tanacetum coccineum]